VQQAAKGVRRQHAEISDVQAIINHYAAKVQAPSSKASSKASAAAAGNGLAAGVASNAAASAAGGAAAAGAGDVYDDLSPGDFVWVPSFVEADQLMKVQLLKVRGVTDVCRPSCMASSANKLYARNSKPVNSTAELR
jgi:hypothetical protein